MNAFDAMLAAARLIAETIDSTATSGSTTTLIDTALQSTRDDFWNAGICFVRSGTYNSSTAFPVLDYTDTGRVLTIASSALAHAIVAGQNYTLCRGQFSRQILLGAINQALTEIVVTQHDDTLVVLADTEEYDLPAGVANVVKVEVASNDAEPYRFETKNYWRENAGQIVFLNNYQPQTADMPIRIWYNAPHPALTLDADTVNAAIHPARLAWMAAYYACLSRAGLEGLTNQKAKDFMGMVTARLPEMAARYPVRTMVRAQIGSML